MHTGEEVLICPSAYLNPNDNMWWMAPQLTPLIYSQLIANPEPNLVIQSNDWITQHGVFPQENKALLLGLWKSRTLGMALTVQSPYSFSWCLIEVSCVLYLGLSLASLGLAVTILPRWGFNSQHPHLSHLRETSGRDRSWPSSNRM